MESCHQALFRGFFEIHPGENKSAIMRGWGRREDLVPPPLTAGSWRSKVLLFCCGRKSGYRQDRSGRLQTTRQPRLSRSRDAAVARDDDQGALLVLAKLDGNHNTQFLDGRSKLVDGLRIYPEIFAGSKWRRASMKSGRCLAMCQRLWRCSQRRSRNLLRQAGSV